MTPIRRIQLQRTAGWRKPPGTVVVARPSKWGNPYRVDGTTVAGNAEAVDLFRQHLWRHPELVEAARRELRGKSLACWCRPGDPCHADVLLEVANA